MFTMIGRQKRERERERERESGAGHSKFHLSDLLMIVVYLGDATSFSLTRHFDGRQAPGKRPKN